MVKNEFEFEYFFSKFEYSNIAIGHHQNVYSWVICNNESITN